MDGHFLPQTYHSTTNYADLHSPQNNIAYISLIPLKVIMPW